MKPKDDKIIAKLPRDDKQELVDWAAERDVSVSQIVREAVREKMARRRKKVKPEAVTA